MKSWSRRCLYVSKGCLLPPANNSITQCKSELIIECEVNLLVANLHTRLLLIEHKNRFGMFTKYKHEPSRINRRRMPPTLVQEVKNIITVSWLTLLQLIDKDINNWHQYFYYTFPAVCNKHKTYIKWDQCLRYIALYVFIISLLYTINYQLH